MMEFKELFGKIYNKLDLTLEESQQAALSMMEGAWEPAHISAFLTGLHMKGESAEELSGFALAMREQALAVPLGDQETMDTCGTGGDQKGSFNISTVAAFVLAGGGNPVAKHGNRAAS
jgi:anthranilate phosphoribosyltransferase